MQELKKTGQTEIYMIAAEPIQRLFEETLFYTEALEAIKYLERNESRVKGWLSVSVTKQTLTVRCEIDLNYLDVLPTTIETFGWVIDQPLVILIDVEENRLLNSLERHEVKTADFNMLH